MSIDINYLIVDGERWILTRRTDRIETAETDYQFFSPQRNKSILMRVNPAAYTGARDMRVYMIDALRERIKEDENRDNAN